MSLLTNYLHVQRRLNAAIVDDVLSRVGLPSELPPALARGREVEIGLAFKMQPHGPGRLERDAWTGLRGRVVWVCHDDDVEIELPNGRGVFVHHGRVRTVDPATGRAAPSPDERESGAAP